MELIELTCCFSKIITFWIANVCVKFHFFNKKQNIDSIEAQGHRGGTEARGEQIRRGQDVFRRPAIMKASETRRSRIVVGSVGYASPALDVPAEATESYGLRDGFWVEFWGGTDLVCPLSHWCERNLNTLLVCSRYPAIFYCTYSIIQVTLICWFGLVVWVFLLTLYFDQRKSANNLLKLKNNLFENMKKSTH